jgi:hypothetical protein
MYEADAAGWHSLNPKFRQNNFVQLAPLGTALWQLPLRFTKSLVQRGNHVNKRPDKKAA